MANGKIDITIGTSYNSAGMSGAKHDVESLANSLGVGTKNGKDLGRAAKTILKDFGDLGSILGGAVGSFLGGGMWTAIAGTIVGVVAKIREHNDLLKDAKLAARGLSREYMSLEHAAKGYAKRVQEWRDKAEAAKKAEADRIKAAKEAARLEDERIRARRDAEKSDVAFKNKQLEIDKLIADEEERIATDEEDLVAVAKARANEMRRAADLAVEEAKNNLAYQNKWGGIHGQDEAEAALELAEKRRERIRKEADRVVEKAEKDAAKRAADEKERLDKEAADKARAAAKKDADARIAALHEEHKAKMDAIDKEIAKAHEEAQVLEQNAARARGGKTFGEWMHGEKQIEREERRKNIRQANVIRNAEKEVAQLESEQRRFGKAFNPARARRLANLREFLVDQDPKNNPALRKAAELEEKRRKAEEQAQKDIAAIKNALLQGVGL